MPKHVDPIPKGLEGPIPYLAVTGGAEAIEFYTRAFGAKERFRMPGPGGAVMHAELEIGGRVLMLSEASPEQGCPSPHALGGTPVSVFLYVADVDRTFEQATRAGAKTLLEPTDMFWGDRFAKLADPFGHTWSLATHREDVPPGEMGERARAAMGG